jgi:protein gp37
MGLTKIQRCHYTFNPWIGCRKVSCECANCYAETLDRNRFSKTMDGGTKENPISHWGSGLRHRTSSANWKDPIKWNKNAAEEIEDAIHDFGSDKYVAPERPRVFCASLGDWLDAENVPIEWLSDLLKLISETPNLDWLSSVGLLGRSVVELR